jgi:hypothetical protein
MPVPDFSPGEVLTASAMDSVAMWLVKTVTVGTGVSSIPVTNAFSADFDNYKITYSGGAGNAFQDISMVLGATVSNYYWVDLSTSYVNGAVVGLGSNTTSNAYWRVGKNTTDGSIINMDIFNPFLSVRTFYSSNVQWANTGAGSVVNGGYLNNATSYTDFTINPIGSTLTGGTIRVYGYRK